ncbi:hypothetical protein Tco_1285323 [Tanacetum coccineum]
MQLDVHPDETVPPNTIFGSYDISIRLTIAALLGYMDLYGTYWDYKGSVEDFIKFQDTGLSCMPDKTLCRYFQMLDNTVSWMGINRVADNEAEKNVATGDEHLASEETEKMVDGQENVVGDSLIPRNDESNIPGTRIEPRSNKESSEVEITKDKERREKGKIIEETRNSPIPTSIRSPRIHTNLVSSDTEKLQELKDTHTTSSSSSPHTKLSKMNRLLSLFKTKPTCLKRSKSFFQEFYRDVMVTCLQHLGRVPEQVRNQVPVYVAKGLILERKKAKEETERLIAKAILQELQRGRRTSEYERLCVGVSSSGQVFQGGTSSINSTTSLVHSFQKDPEAQALSLINQDLWYLKKGNSGPEKIVLSLHKFPAVIFNDDDMEEQTSAWETERAWENQRKSLFELKIIHVSMDIWDLYNDMGKSALTSNWNCNVEQKYGYVQKDLTKDEAEYLKLFEEEIKERLKHLRQMRRWDMFVNERPLGP